MRTHVLLALARRNFARNARQSAFGLAAIAFGVFGLAIVAGFIEDVYRQLGEATVSGQLGHLQVTRQGYRSGGAAMPEEFLIREPGNVIRLIEADSRVGETMSRVQFSGLVTSSGSRELAVEVEGLEAAPEARLGARLAFLQGRHLAATDQAAAIVGEGVAESLRAGVGSLLHLTAATRDGALNVVDVEVVGVFRSFSKEFDARAVRVPISMAKDLLQSEAVTTVVVRLGDTADTRRVLEATSGPLAAAGMEIRPWYQLSDFYSSTRNMYGKQFGLLRLIALVLVVMSVVNALNATVYERTAEYGTMRALGNSSVDVFGLIVFEAALLGICGAMVGLIMASAGALVISQVGIQMPPPPNMEAGYVARIALNPTVLLVPAGTGLIAAVLASLLPALRVTRLAPVEALRKAT